MERLGCIATVWLHQDTQLSLDALNYFELTLQKKRSESTSCRKMPEWMRRGVIDIISAMKS